MPASKVAVKKAETMAPLVFKTSVKPKTKALSVGAQIDALHELREKKRVLDSQVKEIEAQIADATEALMEKLKTEGLDKSTGKKATVSVSENIVGNVKDWDVLWAYILKTKQTHLLQRRLSDPAVRELFEIKGSVPGVEPFVKRTLNLRAVKAAA